MSEPNDDLARGLYRKFEVYRTNADSHARHLGCFYFVLDVDHDRHALAALLAYADSCDLDFPALAADLRRAVSARLEQGM